MSELKSYDLVDIQDYRGEVYLKSEADKVIAELKDEASTAHRVCSRQIQQIASNEQEIRHHKYKRCLAMAQWCKDKVDAIKNGYIRSSIESQKGIMTTCPPECNPKFSFYSKWRKRWLALAEEPTRAKFLQLIHKEAK